MICLVAKDGTIEFRRPEATNSSLAKDHDVFANYCAAKSKTPNWNSALIAAKTGKALTPMGE